MNYENMFNDLGNLENLSENERRTIEQLRALFGMANDEQAKDIKFNVVKSVPQVIPIGAGRPERDVCINDEDMMNLTIAFNTCNTIEEFIAKI